MQQQQVRSSEHNDALLALLGEDDALPPHVATREVAQDQDLDQSSDLAATPPETGADPIEVQASQESESSEAPAPPDFNALLAGFVGTIEATEKLFEAQQEREVAMFGKSITDMPSFADVERIRNAIVDRMIRLAETAFAPTGGKLDIDRNEAKQESGYDAWLEELKEHDDRRWRSRRFRNDDDTENEADALAAHPEFDLNLVWAYLERTYGGEAGERRGLAQAAAEIINFFNLRSLEQVERGKNGVTISVRMFSTKKDYGQNQGLYELSSGYSRDLDKMIEAMRCFIMHTDAGLHYRDWVQPDFASSSYGFSSRQKFDLHNCQIVFYKDKWEFKFAHDVAEQLMLFLGEYDSNE